MEKIERQKNISEIRKQKLLGALERMRGELSGIIYKF